MASRKVEVRITGRIEPVELITDADEHDWFIDKVSDLLANALFTDAATGNDLSISGTITTGEFELTFTALVDED